MKNLGAEHENLDQKAYEIIFITEIGGKEFLKSILHTCNIITASYQYLSSEGLVRRPNETIKEHLAVIKAIADKDLDAAEALMREHLKKSIEHLKQDIEKEAQSTDGGKIIRRRFNTKLTPRRISLWNTLDWDDPV